MTTTPADISGDNPEARVSERIVLLMFRKKITQTAMAKALGVSQSAVSWKLHGRSRWTLADLVTVAEVLSVDLDEVLDPILSSKESRPLNGDGTSDASRLRESNPRPIHYE